MYSACPILEVTRPGIVCRPFVSGKSSRWKVQNNSKERRYQPDLPDVVDVIEVALVGSENSQYDAVANQQDVKMQRVDEHRRLSEGLQYTRCSIVHGVGFR